MINRLTERCRSMLIRAPGIIGWGHGRFWQKQATFYTFSLLLYDEHLCMKCHHASKLHGEYSAWSDKEFRAHVHWKTKRKLQRELHRRLLHLDRSQSFQKKLILNTCTYQAGVQRAQIQMQGIVWSLQHDSLIPLVSCDFAFPISLSRQLDSHPEPW